MKKNVNDISYDGDIGLVEIGLPKAKVKEGRSVVTREFAATTE